MCGGSTKEVAHALHGRSGCNGSTPRCIFGLEATLRCGGRPLSTERRGFRGEADALMGVEVLADERGGTVSCAAMHVLKGRPSVTEPADADEATLPTMDANTRIGGVDRAILRYYRPLTRVAECVLRNPARPISLTAAAAASGFKPKYFSTYFRSKTGMTFTEWLARIRTEKAMELMRSRHIPITQVAFAVGFNDLRGFERWFQRVVGCAPSTFRAGVVSTLEKARDW